MPVDHGEAEALAIKALAYVAGSEKLLPRFLQLTGIEAASIRNAAGEAGFLAGVLQFVAAHEPTLIEFCDATDTRPDDIMVALRALPNGEEPFLANP